MGFLTVLGGKKTQQGFSFSQFHGKRGVGLYSGRRHPPTFSTRRRDALCWRDEFTELSGEGQSEQTGNKEITKQAYPRCLQVFL